MSKVQEKIKDIYNSVIETNDLRYDGTFNDLDYFGLFCKAGAKDRMYKLLGCNVCMFNCIYEDEDSVMILFSIPQNSETGSKHIADKVMEIIECMERCFINIDYTDSKEIKHDKFIYVTVIKKVRK